MMELDSTQVDQIQGGASATAIIGAVIGGALTGGAIGSTVGAAIGGPIGAGFGGAFGVIAGGAGASFTAAAHIHPATLAVREAAWAS
ncbi:Blp family class II bacteriocin [Frateuria aurantia]|uniref:Bacteriocin class II with double-glycine leader peptide n=1 Tax=Frateuria aurantia (strain ATCC 33424 / DSM 6220 / KCTC 2777 / LMG 1558 / NBRC 3245 / NCIMB 13370) TaxID=767434 RepID=H8KYJ8_FRAAD|nr:Blp family class II bacteriocin [Frateuria aurantia]AFC85126.1 Bacteriocin class II with double-glycine leader peptide [Frateuria aurantia DSM 6220]